jgi:Bacterial SH3 domain
MKGRHMKRSCSTAFLMSDHRSGASECQSNPLNFVFLFGTRLPLWRLGLWLCMVLLLEACTNNNYLTVEQVWKNAKEYDGKIIHVQGKAEYSTMMTLVLCLPSRCDCNETTGIFHLVDDPPSHVNAKYSSIDYLWVSAVNCQGDECSQTCSPIQPESGIVYRFIGKLKVTYQDAEPAELQLTDVDFSSSRQLVNGAWVVIPTGTFTTQTRTYGCPGAPDTRLSITDITRVSVNAPRPFYLHSNPSISADTVGQLAPGDDVQVLDGPQCADNLTWFKVRSMSGLEGWVAEGDKAAYWLVDRIQFDQATPIQMGVPKTYDLREIRITVASGLVNNIESIYYPLETPVPTPLSMWTPWPNESREGRAGMEDEWVNYAEHSLYKITGTIHSFLTVFDLRDPLSRSYLRKKDGTDCLDEIRKNLENNTLEEDDLNPFCGMNGTMPLRFIVNRKMIQFSGGMGYRFLISSSLNESLRWNYYIFQGLSDDDRFFIYLFYDNVAALFNYSNQLPEDNTAIDFNDRMQKLLDAAMVPFDPPLEVLDAMMSSIEIK